MTHETHRLFKLEGDAGGVNLHVVARNIAQAVSEAAAHLVDVDELLVQVLGGNEAVCFRQVPEDDPVRSQPEPMLVDEAGTVTARAKSWARAHEVGVLQYGAFRSAP